MPDYSDDAPKRQRRGGVLPPFFAPRVTPRDDSSVAPSGGWRRASRLFTPPDVPRQHSAAQGRSAAEPTRTASPSTVPATVPVESVVSAQTAMPTVSDVGAASEVPEVQSGAAESAVPAAPAVPTAPLEAALPPGPVTAGAALDATPMATFPLGIAEGSEAEPIEDISWPTSSTSESPSAGDGSEGERSLDAAGSDLVIQSFQSQPISLSSREPIVAADSAAGILDEYYGSTNAGPSVSESGYGDESTVNLDAPWSEAGPARPEEAPPLDDSSSQLPDARESIMDIAAPSYAMSETPPAAPVPPLGPAAWSDDSLAFDDAMTDPTGVAPAEASEGQGGWSAADGVEGAGNETDVPERDREESDVTGEVPDDSVSGMTDRVGRAAPESVADEMADALAWDDDAKSGLDRAQPSSADLGSLTADGEALSGTGRELRDSAALWISGTGGEGERVRAPDAGGVVAVDVDVVSAGVLSDQDVENVNAVNVHAESVDAVSVDAGNVDAVRVDAVGVDGASAGSEFVDTRSVDAGATVADALARVAERIRAGEVKLSPEAAGASDEGALAAALAALLRRAPRG
jgi:hypothetical protein